MKRYFLNGPTVVALVLIPIVAVLRATPEISSDYGNGDITSNSVLLLMFGIYCFAVSTINLIRVNRLWKSSDPAWKRTMGIVYCYILLFAATLGFLMLIPDGFNTASFLSNFVFGLFFGGLPFLFSIGIVLFVLGINGAMHANNKPKAYLVITFLISFLFTLGGAFPGFWISLWWFGGGLNLCYCPVNRRSFKKDVLLKPLYAYRRKQLAKRLQIQR